MAGGRVAGADWIKEENMGNRLASDGFDLQCSPIRKNLAGLQKGELSLFELNEDDAFFDSENLKKFKKLQVRDILSDVENIMDTIVLNKGKKTNIAIMGEVKAGKSTFINACIGKKVAYTDILEATALVSEILYSGQEYVHILGQGGDVKLDMSLEELMDWMEEQVDEEADFSEYSMIEVGVKSPLLENATIVDTPGLLSITTKNQNITHKYIAQTDFVLWTINSRDLGSTAVNDYIRKIQSSGKPLIGIITKVDTPEIKNEIANYIQEHYGNIFEGIFYVSSIKACELQEQGDPDWAEKTGFAEVLDCIADLSEDKEHSVVKTRYYQLQRDKELHQKLREIIRERKEYYDRELNSYETVNHEIKEAVSSELARWITSELYQDERQRVIQASEGELESLLQQFGSNAYLNEQLMRKRNEIVDYINRKWEIVVDSVSLDASSVLIDFSYSSPGSDYGSATAVNPTSGNRSSAIVDGLKRGALTGVAFAGYCAWLGPAAASVSFIGALVPVTVPIALAGAAVGAFLDSDKNAAQKADTAKKKRDLADGLYHQAVRLVKENFLLPTEQYLHKLSDSYCHQRQEYQAELVQNHNFDFTEPAYTAFMEELDHYIHALDAAVNAAHEDPLPPLEQETAR